MTQAAVFPGQGSQYVGMCLDLIERHPQLEDIFNVADKLTGLDIYDLINEGPKEDLDETINAQPAIFVANYIYWSLLAAQGFRPDYVAGHSLGELSACLAAGVFGFEQGLYIVRHRAEFMAETARRAGGAMAAVLGLHEATVAQVAAGIGLEVANFNCPGQVVVAGSLDGMTKGLTAFKSAGAKKVVQLPVKGAFHSTFMSEAAAKFAVFFEEQSLADPQIPIIGNSGAQVLFTAADVRHELAKQIDSPVRWQESINQLLGRGVDKFIEVGPGRVLSGLIKRISSEVVIEHAVDRFSA